MPGAPAVSIGQHSIAGRRPRNDDSFGVLVPAPPLNRTKGIAVAIADGMSSSEAAKQASETCVRSFLDDYFATHETWPVKKSAAIVLTAINNWLYAQGQAHASGPGLVSTFSGLVLKSGMAHIFHVGDSRIARLRDGTVEPLTRDHRVRGGAQREYLARAFGVQPDLEIDYRAEATQPGDVFIFTTDGVHDHVAPLRMAEAVIGAGDDLQSAARRIVEQAYERGSEDNLTCQIVRVTDAGEPDETAHLKALTELPFPPELAPGMRFEGYRIVRALHLSKRTEVYLAEEAQGGLVVLKTPSVNYEDDPAYIDMFRREEWIGRLVASPHVLKVLQPPQQRRHLYYITEHFEGQTLRQWMHDNPRPELETVRGIVEQIAKGLRAFHRKEVLHLDLKPENIMIDRFGAVKIIDFGAARAAGIDEIASPVETPVLVGTLDYTAPELHLGERPSSRTDIYALGTLTYELLTGRLPYGKGFAGRRDVGRRAYISARSLREDIPAWIDAALAKAVAKRPAERTEALSELTTDLRRPNTALGFERTPTLLERDPAMGWKLVAAALVLLSAALAFLLLRR